MAEAGAPRPCQDGDVKVRPYHPDDEASCLALFDGNTPRFFAQAERPDFAAFLAVLSDPYLVIEEGGQVVACGGLYVRPGGQEAGLTWGMVERSRHRQGYGRALWEARLDWLRAHAPEVRAVVLDTTQHSAPFFARLGFGTVGVRPDFYAPGLDRHDMRLTVPGGA